MLLKIGSIFKFAIWHEECLTLQGHQFWFMIDFQEVLLAKTDEELLQMVYQFDKWSPRMLESVESELNARNILPVNIKTERERLIGEEEQKLVVGREASSLGLIAGWLTIFGFLGIVIGYNYAFSKTKSRYIDKKYFTYNEKTRKIGLPMFYVSLILSAGTLFYKLLTLNQTNI